jgi:hypothetical protein
MIEPQGQTPHIKFSRANLENSEHHGNAHPRQSTEKAPNPTSPILQNKFTKKCKKLVRRKKIIYIYL